MDDPIIEESFGEDRDIVYTSLDDREALERQIAAPNHDAGLTLGRWRAAVDATSSEEDIRNAINSLGANVWQPLEGTSWRRWATWFENRLQEAVDHPDTVLPSEHLPDHYTWRRRTTTRLDPDAADRWAREASRVDVRRIEDWLAADADGGVHLYLLYDTGQVVGEVSDLEERDTYGHQLVVRSRSSTRVGVRLSRSLTGNGMHPFVRGVHVAEPVDDPRAASWRAAWPTLTAVLGGCFSDTYQLTPWTDQRRMLFAEPAAVLDRLAAEGDELLRLDDDDLHAAVVALGCFVEPPHLRLWLTWMFWRIRTFDWNPEELDP
ncbi:hypothetical protein [Kineococcus rubinsiae]|uniref:hypothetical protein n=1 Tax=Kineococcus rubinsiae TaxID=2609562 RepID=UPI00142F9029|nr:hypothetical protein [Kineococcus rubinsiae]NIZ90058.1 hypothetical protein [Kineococcus rubinsiae]